MRGAGAAIVARRCNSVHAISATNITYTKCLKNRPTRLYSAFRCRISVLCVGVCVHSADDLGKCRQHKQAVSRHMNGNVKNRKPLFGY